MSSLITTLLRGDSSQWAQRLAICERQPLELSSRGFDGRFEECIQPLETIKSSLPLSRYDLILIAKCTAFLPRTHAEYQPLARS